MNFYHACWTLWCSRIRSLSESLSLSLHFFKPAPGRLLIGVEQLRFMCCFLQFVKTILRCQYNYTIFRYNLYHIKDWQPNCVVSTPFFRAWIFSPSARKCNVVITGHIGPGQSCSEQVSVIFTKVSIRSSEPSNLPVMETACRFKTFILRKKALHTSLSKKSWSALVRLLVS